jgi:hypothetical protein
MAGIVVLRAFARVLDAAVGRFETRLRVCQPKAGDTEKQLCGRGRAGCIG